MLGLGLPKVSLKRYFEYRFLSQSSFILWPASGVAQVLCRVYVDMCMPGLNESAGGIDVVPLILARYKLSVSQTRPCCTGWPGSGRWPSHLYSDGLARIRLGPLLRGVVLAVPTAPALRSLFH